MPQSYEIRINGHLDLSWSDWLDEMTITHRQSGETVIAGQIADQAALYGLLNKLRDMSVSLVSVNPLDGPSGGDTSGYPDVDSSKT